MDALHTYSLVKALYDEGSDYIDAFWPFVVHSLPTDHSLLAPGSLADEVARRFGLKIPVHTVETLADRARRSKRLVERRNNAFAITDAGITYLTRLETSRQVERRVSALIAHASAELSAQDARFTDRAFTASAVNSVIETHRRIFDYASEQPRTERLALTSNIEEAILDYFVSLEHGQPEHFETLRDLILGTTLAGLLQRDDISDGTRQFRRTALLLDTNVLLSLLGLRFDAACRPAQELLALLNSSSQFDLYSLDFTLEELTNLLEGYAANWKRYDPEIHVNDLYSSLRYRGMTPADVAVLIADLPTRLKNLGVSVMRTGTFIENDTAQRKDAISRLATYKPEQDIIGRRHDIAAIEWVAQSRHDLVRKVEDGRAFLLTEDYRLSNYAYVERGHRSAHTVSEVMPDRLLTNLLWLKKPDTLAQVPIATVIAMHSRDLFINRQVWQRFYACVEQLTVDRSLDADAVTVLLHDAQVRKNLANLDTGEHRTVNREWVLDQAAAARTRADARERITLTEQAQALGTERDAKLSMQARAHMDELRMANARVAELARKLQDTVTDEEARRNGLRAQEKAMARRQATWAIRITRLTSLVALAWVTIHYGRQIVSSLEKVPGFFEGAPYVGAAALFLAGVTVDPKHLWASLSTRIADILLTRRLKRLAPFLVDSDGR